MIKSCPYLITFMMFFCSSDMAEEQKSELWKAHYVLKIFPEEKKVQVDATFQLQQAYGEIWLEIPTYSFDELISDVHASDEGGNLLPLENVSDEF